MSGNLLFSPYLRDQRYFPRDDVVSLSTQVDQAYIDIAGKVNVRTIGVFATNVPVVTGERWYISGGSRAQQTLRQLYTFGAIAPGTELDIPTGLPIDPITKLPTDITMFTRIYGEVITTNGSLGKPDYRPLPYVDPATLTTSMTVLVGNAIVDGVEQLCIRIVLGATAVPVTSGFVVLEWLSIF